MAADLSHLNERGEARMVDVSGKAVTLRTAVAMSRVSMSATAFQAACAGELPKGDLASVVRLAGIAGAKKTSDLVPLCHPLFLESVEVEVQPVAAIRGFDIRATCRTSSRTGVEMEALVAASSAALALYDMVKAVDRSAVIGPVAVVAKSGGKSGSFSQEWPPPRAGGAGGDTMGS